YPDDRNDDYALSFHWDDQLAYPQQRKVKTGNETKEHSLRVQAGDGVIQHHGIYQSRIPIRAGLEYRGSLWLKTTDYERSVKVVLESDVDQGQVYAATEINWISKGEWRKYKFSLRPARSDPLARLVILFPGKGR